MPSGSREISGQCDPQEQSLEIVHPLDRWPDAGTTVVLAAQWMVILVPGLLVLGQVVGLAWGLDSAGRIEFMQRLLLVTALTQAAQVLWGHRLPGLAGPSAVLIVGVLATIASGPASVAGAMAVGGGLTALAGLTGLAARLGRLYTPPVLASTLLLVAVSLTPTMRDLLYHAPAAGQAVSGPFLFGLGLVLLMLLAQFRLKGLWSSASVLMGLVVGSLVYYALGLEPWPTWRAGALAGPPPLLPTGLGFEPGVIVAFLLCYLALISNELATIESTGRLIQADRMGGRANRGVAVSGLGGVLARDHGLTGAGHLLGQPGGGHQHQERQPLHPVARRGGHPGLGPVARRPGPVRPGAPAGGGRGATHPHGPEHLRGPARAPALGRRPHLDQRGHLGGGPDRGHRGQLHAPGGKGPNPPLPAPHPGQRLCGGPGPGPDHGACAAQEKVPAAKLRLFAAFRG